MIPKKTIANTTVTFLPKAQRGGSPFLREGCGCGDCVVGTGLADASIGVATTAVRPQNGQLHLTVCPGWASIPNGLPQ